MKKIYVLALVAFYSFNLGAQVVISQVYGAGGNGSAIYTHDFIELFNRGSVAQSLNGWSVQYTSAAGTLTAPNNFWFSTPLPNVLLQPGQYFLIQQAIGGGVGVALPTPDLNGITAASLGSNGAPISTGFTMSGTNGKVILVSSTTQETTINPSGSQIIDKVGYGSTPTGFEGTGPTGTALTNPVGVLRNNAGCTDTNNNATDFTVGTPTARNTATALNVCSTNGIKENSIAGLSIYPNPAKNILNITSDSSEAKSVAIYNVLGKVVLSEKVTNAPINIANLASGVYVIKVSEGDKTASRKLVIE